MKRIITGLLFTIACAILTSAQTANTSNLRFYFHYIAHDETTPVSAIIEKLQEDYYTAVEDDETFPHPAIFYLSSGTRPIIVKINLPGDNRADFDEVLLPELYQRNSHEVDPETDIEELNKLFDECGLISENNRLQYMSAYFNFYVTPQFWNVRNNERIIAPLFMGLDAPNVHGNFLDNWNIYQPARDHISYPDKDKPFGEKNVCGINEYLKGKIQEIGY